MNLLDIQNKYRKSKMWEGVCEANRGVVEEIYLNKFYLNCYCKYNNLQICNFHLTVQSLLRWSQQQPSHSILTVLNIIAHLLKSINYLKTTSYNYLQLILQEEINVTHSREIQFKFITFNNLYQIEVGFCCTTVKYLI